ncbi:MAG: S9 family peptidase, partial [Anaerolineae bacterium]|nr:S9 family peptidase [Anaerolineae bacterium]
PYGTWSSPITSDLIVSGSISLGSSLLDGETLYWLEGRPKEGGRYVIVRRDPDDTIRDVNPAPYNARTRVHEYGGGAVVVDGGIVVFSNYADQRLYIVRPDADPAPLTAAPPAPCAWRYADGVVDVARHRIICVREDHTDQTVAAHGEAANAIAAISLGDGSQQVLVSGNDFYAAPRLSPDATRLAWLTWHHPNMPWDGTELWIADLEPGGGLRDPRCVAGGPSESIFQPTWSPDGALTYASDRSGWWNLYCLEADTGESRRLVDMPAEFGLPQWVFGMSTYAYVSAERIVCSYTQDGTDHLAWLDVATGTLTRIETPYTTIGSVVANDSTVCFRGGAPTRVSALVALDVASGTQRVLRRAITLDVDIGYLSAPEPLSYPSVDATGAGRTAHGLYYPPVNQDFIAPAEEKPPLLVFSHGGPTGATSSALSLHIQYWTSRGFAVLDVNYGGSSGYGRAYRDQLLGTWGIVDVDDCANGARYLVDQGCVDGERLAIRGGSAGGYTTLSALAFRDVFDAGASHYGVSDLEALARDTHKFESRYLDRLIGPYPERRDLYLARSPIYHLEGLSCPIIFFQGLEDQVVPPDQAETMVAALQEKGIPVAYVPFEGEQHGFRRAENIKRALDAELYFYGRIFGFEPADEIEPVEIRNL